jgi:DNA-binding transcriptional regulator YbjK
MEPGTRRDEILDVAAKLVRKAGLTAVRRGDIAKAAAVSGALITHYFGDMRTLQAALVDKAIVEEDTIILRQGIAAGFPRALKAPLKLRKAAVRSML